MRKLLLLVAFGTVATYGFAQEQTFTLAFPKGEKWKVATEQADGQITMREYVVGKEKVTNWTTFVTVIELSGVKVPSLDAAYEIYVGQFKERCPDATIRQVEDFELQGRKARIYTVECPRYPATPQVPAGAESQLHLLVLGNGSLITCQVAQRKAALDADFISKWAAVYKASSIVEN